MQQIIATKKVDKRKFLAIFRKSIKLELEDYKIVKNLTIKIKYLFIKNKVYVFRNKNNVLCVETIRY